METRFRVVEYRGQTWAEFNEFGTSNQPPLPVVHRASITAGVGILPQWTLRESQAKSWFFDYDPKFESHPEEGKSGKSFAAFQEAQNHGFLPR
jgi:hypothetical protein